MVHAKRCGHGIGIFFLMLEGTIVLIYRVRLVYSPNVYVDEYGERNPRRGVNHGRPLHLDIAHVAHLRQLYLTHGIPRLVVKIQN